MRQQLRLQVVGHEAVAPGERSRALAPHPAGPDRQRGEVQTRGPALRLLGELARSARPAGPRRPRSGAGPRPPRPCEARPARSPARAPAPAAPPAATAARLAPTEPAASPQERASRVPRRRRGRPGYRAGAGRPEPRRPLGSIVARAAPRRGTTVASTETPGDANASNTPGSSGETRSSAAATYVSRTIGSLSLMSTSTHANGRRDREAHCASSVVFPQPGPRTGTPPGSRPSPPASRSGFREGPRRLDCAARSFDSKSSNAGADGGGTSDTCKADEVIEAVCGECGRGVTLDRPRAPSHSWHRISSRAQGPEGGADRGRRLWCSPARTSGGRCCDREVDILGPPS